MKAVTLLLAVALIGIATGCGSKNEPLIVGELKSGTFWKNSLASSSPSNEGGSYPAGSRVEVYGGFVHIITPQGTSHIHPHGFYSDLSIEQGR